MDLMQAISAIPRIGPLLPYLVVGMVLNGLIIAPSMAPPGSPSSFYAFLYRVANALAGNFGHAKNASAPASGSSVAPTSAMAVLVACCTLMLLSACGSLPTVKIDATTGVATVAPPTAPAPKPSSLQDVAIHLATVFTDDDAAAVNMACGKPVVDPIGCNFYTDLANLSGSVAGTASPSVKGLLTLAETARLALASGTGAPNKLLIQTYTDGVIWLADTRAKAIAVPAAVTGLLAQINATLLVPAL